MQRKQQICVDAASASELMYLWNKNIPNDCRFRKNAENQILTANFAVDTSENEPMARADGEVHLREAELTGDRMEIVGRSYYDDGR